MDTATEKEVRRATVESQFNTDRDQIEKTFVADRQALEEQYHVDLETNRQAKERALVAAGLNPDGSDPQERQQGSAE